jgi:hypothetical protein
MRHLCLHNLRRLNNKCISVKQLNDVSEKISDFSYRKAINGMCKSIIPHAIQVICTASGKVKNVHIQHSLHITKRRSSMFF